MATERREPGSLRQKAAGRSALSEVEGSARATRSLSLVVSDEGSKWLLWDVTAVFVPPGCVG
jgi:hypothetical protein